MTQCPEHPRTVGATATDCAACRREAVPPTPEYLAAKASMPRRNRPVVPTPPPTSLADTRARADAQETP